MSLSYPTNNPEREGEREREGIANKTAPKPKPVCVSVCVCVWQTWMFFHSIHLSLSGGFFQFSSLPFETERNNEQFSPPFSPLFSSLTHAMWLPGSLTEEGGNLSARRAKHGPVSLWVPGLSTWSLRAEDVDTAREPETEREREREREREIEREEN